MSRVGFFTTDAALVIRTWDRGMEAMTTRPAEQTRGRRLDEVVPDLEARGLLDIIREPLASGATQVLAAALHRFIIPCPPAVPSDAFVQMQQRVVITPLRDERDIVGLLFEVEDVTARIEEERALARRIADPDPAVRRAALTSVGSAEVELIRGPLSDDDWQVRRLAVSHAAETDNTVLVAALVAALRHGHRDFNLLSSTIKLLSSSSLDASAPLLDLLQDADPDLRIQAALALGTRATPAAVRALIAALDDPDVNVRFHAIEALGRLRATEAVEPLTAILASREFFLAYPALEALGQIGEGVSAADLVPLLEDPVLSSAAADALAQMGDEDAVPPLVAALDRADAPAAALIAALTSIHARSADVPGASEYVEDLVRRHLSPAGAERLLDIVGDGRGALLRHAVAVLGWARSAAIERGLARLVASSAVDRDVIDALGGFGTSMIDVLVDQLSAEDIDVRRAAAAAVGRIGDARAVPALIETIADADRDLLVSAIGALAQIGDPRAYEALLPLIGDGDVAVRQAAISALNSIGHPGMARRVGELLGSSDPRVRESAVRIAGYFGYPGCADGLLRCAADDQEAVRAAALEHLGYLDDPRAIAVLSAAIANGTPRARAAAATALGHVDDSVAVEVLRKAAADPDSWVRYFSAISLGRQCAAVAAAEVASLARHDPAPHVRAAAAEALAAIGGELAMATLLELCATRETDVAVAAIRALARIDDSPAAVTALREALRTSDPVRRVAAAEALAGRRDGATVEALWQAAQSDADQDVMRAAIAALAATAAVSGGASAAFEALASAASDPRRRAIVRSSLTRLSEAAVPVLGEWLEHPDHHLRAFAVDALGRVARPSASALLLRALDDREPEVRQHAVAALARLGTRGVVRRLISMARADSSPAVRRAAERAVSGRLAPGRAS